MPPRYFCGLYVLATNSSNSGSLPFQFSSCMALHKAGSSKMYFSTSFFTTVLLLPITLCHQPKDWYIPDTAGLIHVIPGQMFFPTIASPCFVMTYLPQWVKKLMYLPFPVTKLQDTNFLVPFALVSKQLHNTPRDSSGYLGCQSSKCSTSKALTVLLLPDSSMPLKSLSPAYGMVILWKVSLCQSRKNTIPDTFRVFPKTPA